MGGRGGGDGELHHILSPIPFATRSCVLTRQHGLKKNGNNKNKPFIWLLCWQSVSIPWGKNGLPHTPYSLNAKKAVFKRQKQP